MINWENFHDFFQHFDKELIFDMINLLEEDYETSLAEIKSNIEKNDSKELVRKACWLKGMIATFYDPETVEFAYNLQNMGQTNLMADAPEEFERLKSAMESLMNELKHYKKKLIS